MLGVAGLPGSGRNELPYALVGALPGATGRIDARRQRLAAGAQVASFDIPMVPADRAREATIGEFSVEENLTLSVLRRFRRFGLLRSRPSGSWSTNGPGRSR